MSKELDYRHGVRVSPENRLCNSVPRWDADVSSFVAHDRFSSHMAEAFCLDSQPLSD